MNRYLYNPISRGNKGEKSLSEVISLLQDEEYIAYNILEYENYDQLLESFTDEDKIIVIGGDGTLHRFVNEVPVTSLDVYFYAGGTGNDFMREFSTPLVKYSEYIDKPKIITDQTEYMVNGFATGIDVSVLRQYHAQKSHSKLVYFKLAIKNIFTYKPRRVNVMIDGKKHTFERTYISAVQNGTAFGGGMKVTPYAKNNDGLLDVCIVHNIKPLKLLFIFISVYFGKHLYFKKHVFYEQGRDVLIEVDEKSHYSSDGEISEKSSKQFRITL